MDMALSAWKLISRTSPLSTTASTSSMVTDDSAMLVARMTLILPSGAGLKHSCCSSCGTWLCSGMMRMFLRIIGGSASSVFMHSLISSRPGRNTSTEPLRPLASSALAMSPAVCAASATTSSSRSRFSLEAPEPPPRLSVFMERRAASRAFLLTMMRCPGRLLPPPVSARRMSTARRSVLTRFLRCPARPPLALWPLSAPPSISVSRFSHLLSPSLSSPSSSSSS
mmetsp:Transcript_16644/g.40778  ORF Transcript_16644/g.40778 Transcript_16644/m.40778 type:complete len:225 (-) Transcript_16644:2523-3197(-)